MRFNIRGENVEVTDAIRDYIIKKVEKLEKYFNGDISEEAQVRLKVYDNLHRVEVTIPMKSLLLRAEEVHGDMYAAIDCIVDKLERQVRKYKTKINRKPRQKGSIKHNIPNDIAVLELETEQEENHEDFDIVRTKQFDLKPMDEEEAILQMEMLGHQFFVYSDRNDEATNVVYKRKDGKYGLIETN